MTQHSLTRSFVLATAALLVSAAAAQAQTITDRDDSRGEDQLMVEVRRAIDRDTDTTNTALVFNNTAPTATHVVCTAYNAAGRMIGRKVARIPGRGVRYLSASDLSGGADFIGSAVCASRTRVAASAVFLAPGSLTNLDVIQAGPWDDTKIRFPLIATY